MLEWIRQVTYVYSVALFYGAMVAMAQVKSIVTKGPSRVFAVKERKRPAVLDDPSYGEHGFVKLKDVKLHYVASGSQDKPLMLFVHGFPEFWYSWRHQIKHFSNAYRTVAVDTRGYGDSDKPQGVDNYSLPRLAADLDQLIVALGYEKCVMVGHDWGAVVAWATGAMYPNRLDRLIILNGPHHTGFFDFIMKSKKQFKMSWYMFFFMLPRLPEFAFRAGDFSMLAGMFKSKKMGSKQGTFTNEDMEAFKYSFRDHLAVTSAINYYRYNLLHAPWVARVMKKEVHVPTLIIWGTGDRALDAQLVDVSKSFVTEDCQVNYIKDGSHWIQQEEPEQVNECMSKYLQQEITRKYAGSKL